MGKVDQALIERVLRTLTTPEDVDYFFDNLKSPDWIEPLAVTGLFATPPEPVQLDGAIQFPSWSASRYLARMAGRSPEQVRDVLRNLHTDNVRVLHDYVDAVSAMPPTMTVEFVPVMVQWLDTPFQLLLPTKLAQLVIRLAKANLPDSAILLARALFDVRPGTPFHVGTDNDNTSSSG